MNSAELREPRRERNVLALPARPASRARPTARRPRRARRAPPSGSPSCSPSERATAVWWTIMSSTSWRPESANSSPTRKRCNGGFPDPIRRIAASRRPRAPELVVVLDGLQRDVVAEPLRLLVRVGVAADVDEQRRVVDDRALVLVEPDALGEPERDQALPQDVLHRLPEAEVDAERERGDQLRQPHPRAVVPARHAPRLLLPPGRDKRGSATHGRW